MKTSKIILLPNLLSEDKESLFLLPSCVKDMVDQIDGLIAESRKSGIRYLITFTSRERANTLPILLLNEHTSEKEVSDLFSEIKKGGTWGLISDAGLPCLADPGSRMVQMAYENNIEVIALPGPSSIILALQLSGFSGQNFAFNGYLPRDPSELVERIKTLEKRALMEKSTQVFIEAPYRSDKLLQLLLSNLDGNMKLSVAVDLTMVSQSIYTFDVKKWKKKQIEIGKRPAVFLFSAI